MKVTWLPLTTQGYMVGDYISTSFVVAGKAYPVIAVAHQNAGTVLDEAMYVPQGGLATASGSNAMGNEAPVPGAASDHATTGQLTQF
jgi:hypothetical protein